MRRLLAAGAIIAMWLLAGCASEETRQLAQGTRDFHCLQKPRFMRVVEAARASGAITDEEKQDMIEDREAIQQALRSLSEIIGEPKEPVEVDSW